MSRAASSPVSQTVERARHALRLAVVFLAAGVITAAYAWYSYWGAGRPPLGFIAASVWLAYCALAAVSAWLARRGRTGWSVGLLGGGLMALGVATSALIADVGLVLALAVIIGVASLAGLTLRRPPARLMILSGIAAGAISLLIDLVLTDWLPWQRLPLPALFRDIFLPAIALGIIGLFAVFIARGFSHYRLNTKLLVGFLTVALAPLALVSVRNDRETRAALQTAVNQSLLAAAFQTTATLDAFLTANLNAVATEARLTDLNEFLALTPAERADSPLASQLKSLLGSLQTMVLQNVPAASETRIVQAFVLLDAQGQIALSTAPDMDDTGFMRGDLFWAPRRTGQPYVSPIYFGDDGQASLYFSAPIVDLDGETTGVLVSQVNAGWLQRLIAQSNDLLGPGSGSFAALFDENGLRLADGAASGTNVLRFAALPDAALLARLDRDGRLPKLTAASLDGGLPALEAALTRARASGAPVSFAGAIHYSPDPARPAPDHLAVLVPLTTQPWAVLFAQPQRVALAPAQAQTRSTILLGMLFALAVAGVSVMAARNLARPINQLTLTAERVRGGDLAARAVPLARDEIGQLAETFNTMTAQLQETLNTLEQRVAERTAQLQATADISRATAGIRDLGELLELAVELIRGRFGFYHASVFLIDEAGEYAVLRESTGEIGAQLKARGHRLAVGSRSLVGWVAQNRKPRVARDVAGDPFHFKNPLLPETRSELSLPLLVGDRLLGVLNVQSQELDAFTAEDLAALQVLADQLSVAIENAQLFAQTRAALAEARAQYQQTLSANWRDVLAGGARELVFELEPGRAPGPVALRLPLRLRDQVIGSLELERGPEAAPLTPEEAALMETAAVQLSAALESAVLVQESQARSRRDQLLTRLTDEMRATLDPATLLRHSIRQLGRALGATEVTVRLSEPAAAATSAEAGRPAA